MAETDPQHYGNFVLVERIAVGGMAEIFRAKKLGAEGFEKELVVKRILPHFSEDEAFVTMFKDEARIAANLNHANIVQVYEFDECEGTFYIAMEYIEGKDLKRIMDAGAKRQKPLLPAESVYIIAQVADGLHYAHSRTYNNMPLNIVHRDVSPHNIMVSFDGDVKLMDFGIAKAAARSTKTQAGTVKGKCAYMSPEQARGKDLDGRSDLFSLGICLWEMLTGQRLFVGETEFETLSKVLKAELVPPRDLNPEVHPKLDKIVMQSLARDRDMRFRDLGAFKQALMSFFYQHCDPDQIDIGAYMRWLYRKGPLPRARDAAAPPPTISAPAYRPPAAAAQPEPSVRQPQPAAERRAPANPLKGDTVQSQVRIAAAGSSKRDVGERTAVMPEMVATNEPAPASKSSPRMQAAPARIDPTIPMEPYRPVEAPKVAQPPRSRRANTGRQELRAPTARTGETGKIPVSGSGTESRRKSAKGKTKGFPVGLVAAAIGALLLVGGAIGAYFALFRDGGGDEQEGISSTTGAPAVPGSAAPAEVKRLTVRIVSEPAGAYVKINGEDQLVPTPFSYTKGKPGDQLKIRATKTGYVPGRSDVVLAEDTSEIKLVLEKRK